jgi:hypothetical protein
MLSTLAINGSTNVEKVWAVSTSSTAAKLEFRSNATPGALVDPDGDMHVNLLVLGV